MNNYLIESCEARKTKTGSTFLTIHGNNGLERVVFKCWGVPENINTDPLVGHVITASLKKDSYGNSTQWDSTSLNNRTDFLTQNPDHPIAGVRTHGHINGEGLNQILKDLIIDVIEQGYDLPLPLGQFLLVASTR